MNHGLEIFEDEFERFESQRLNIWHHLLGGMTINSKDARVFYGCERLAARIYDLRKMIEKNPLYKGWEILTHQATPFSVARYELVRGES